MSIRQPPYAAVSGFQFFLRAGPAQIFNIKTICRLSMRCPPTRTHFINSHMRERDLGGASPKRTSCGASPKRTSCGASRCCAASKGSHPLRRTLLAGRATAYTRLPFRRRMACHSEPLLHPGVASTQTPFTQTAIYEMSSNIQHPGFRASNEKTD